MCLIIENGNNKSKSMLWFAYIGIKNAVDGKASEKSFNLNQKGPAKNKLLIEQPQLSKII